MNSIMHFRFQALDAFLDAIISENPSLRVRISQNHRDYLFKRILKLNVNIDLLQADRLRFVQFTMNRSFRLYLIFMAYSIVAGSHFEASI